MSGAWQDSLATVCAPADLREWARSHESHSAAFAACARPDWLVWLARSRAISKEEQCAVVRAAAAVVSLGGGAPAVWRSHLMRWRPDVFDEVALFCGGDDITDSDHRYSDLLNGLLAALLLWSPLDVYLFVRPLGSLAGLRREVITLPTLFVLIFPMIWLWGRIRVAAANRAAPKVAFDDLFARLAPRMAETGGSEAVRRMQLLAARTAFKGLA
jgi:hypothetical protein